MLLGVEAAGDISLGAKRWLAVGGGKFQPSELMKIGLVLALARFYHALSADDARFLLEANRAPGDDRHAGGAGRPPA